MTDPSSRKDAFKKRQSAAFSIDGYNFAIGSKSQNFLWNTIVSGLTNNLKERPKLTIINDPRPPEEILADELLPVYIPEALVKTSFRELARRCHESETLEKLNQYKKEHENPPSFTGFEETNAKNVPIYSD